jgi:hypothetical protein
MIELSKIRTMKTLEAMQKPLKEFVTFDKPTMLSVYAEEFGWGEEDYEADLEQANYMLEQVERRMKSLGHHLAKGDKNEHQSPVPPAVTESVSTTA